MGIYDRFIPAPFVSGRTIAEVWPKALSLIVGTGHIQGPVVDQRGDQVYEVVGLQVVLSDPTRDMIPPLPKMPGVTAWGDRRALDDYSDREILGSKESPRGFEYIYADWIRPPLAWVIDLLRRCPDARRAILPVGGFEDYRKLDPPCLRSVQFLIRGGKLDMVTTWRSRDYAGAAATNMYGLVRLQQHVAKELDILVGRYIDFSASAHIRVGKAGNQNDRGDLPWVEEVITRSSSTPSPSAGRVTSLKPTSI